MACIIKIIRAVFPISLAIILSSCFPGPLLSLKKEIGKTSEFWGGYAFDRVYTLKHNVFIRINSEFTSNQLIRDAKILVPPLKLKKGGLYSAPESIDSFLSSPESYPKVIGVVKQGTAIKCLKIIEYVPIGYRNSLYVYASILEGPYRGIVVEISDLSQFHSKSQGGVLLKEPSDVFLEEKNE